MTCGLDPERDQILIHDNRTGQMELEAVVVGKEGGRSTSW